MAAQYCRGALRAAVDRLFAGLDRSRQVARHRRAAEPRPRLRLGRRRLCRGAGRHRRAGSPGSRSAAIRGRGARLRRPRRDPSGARGRGGVCRDHPGDGRQIPLHLGLHRVAQGSDQQPGDDDRQSGDGRRLLSLSGRQSAGGGRLGALEPYRLGQQGVQHGADQWRHLCDGRGAADARPDRPDHRQPRARPPTWYFNVPVGYEMLVAAMEAEPSLSRRVLLAARDDDVRRRRDGSAHLGRAEAAVGGGDRARGAAGHRPRRDRDGAVLADVHGTAGPAGQCRGAVGRDHAEAGPERRTSWRPG